MTSRIRDFLRNRRDTGLDDGPVLVVDLDVVRDNYQTFAKTLPDTRVFYAVKANPAPEVLALLAKLGSCFDTASVPEIEMVLAAGCTPDRISYGNTIKKERDIARAYALGVRSYAVDCKAEVEKIARVGARQPGVLPHPVRLRRRGMAAVAQVRLRALHGRGRAGARPSARPRGLRRVVPRRLRSSATRTPGTGRSPRRRPCSASAASAASTSSMVNLGGGFPTKYLKNVPTVKSYGAAIFQALRKHFGNRIPETIIEPGRGMVGNAGVIETEVVLVSKKSNEDDVRWVYLDIGKFGGLAETMDEFDPLPDPHAAGRRRAGALRAGRPDLRLGRRAVREAAVRAAGEPGDRRQGADRRDRRLHGDLRVRGIQRLRAVEDLPHLRSPGAGTAGPHIPPKAVWAPLAPQREDTLMITIRKETIRDFDAREALLDLSFGPARFEKASERLREGRLPAAGLAFVASDRGRIVGTARLWNVSAGPSRPALLLGPLAVHPDYRCRGLGAALMEAFARGRQTAWPSHRAVALATRLVTELFGFSAELTVVLSLPGR